MSTSIADSERVTLERLRDDFRSKGYDFIIQPPIDQVPDFLGNRRPDALAIEPHDKVIIEVKQQGSPDPKLLLAQLSQTASSRSRWRYLLVYAGEDPSEIIELSRPRKSQVDQAIQETRSLEQLGHMRAAMVEGWSLLEALAQRLYPEDIRMSLKPLTSMQVIERLAMDGQISHQEAKRLRGLSSIRNSLVHGDLNVSTSKNDVNYVFKIVEAINSRLDL
ncbi:hypothetical protein [Rhodopila sp.]|uniref:hypothetical protein n=1 Tax=Rhodopila sp. TaxID=2480087 RepID=UPI003D0BD715